MNEEKNILVTGANGQLGMEFRQLEQVYTDYNFHFVSKDELSITDNIAVEHFFQNNNIAFCINCAAYTGVDKAETERDIVMQINAEAVGLLATTCKKYSCYLFHFSTDYVFSGEAATPYSESAETEPVNFYGETKLLGEQNALKNNEDTLIIRTSWVYSSHGKNFVKTMMRLFCEKEEIGVVNDQFGCPTYAADLAQTVMQIITADQKAKGIYHYCNTGIISWYDFAMAIKKEINSKCIINEINTAGFPTDAKRPHYSALNTTKIQNEFSLTIPAWQESLSKCIKLLYL